MKLQNQKILVGKVANKSLYVKLTRKLLESHIRFSCSVCGNMYHVASGKLPCILTRESGKDTRLSVITKIVLPSETSRKDRGDPPESLDRQRRALQSCTKHIAPSDFSMRLSQTSGEEVTFGLQKCCVLICGHPGPSRGY